MYGVILGDIIGSPYEFVMGDKSKDIPLFSKNSTYTDDTVMTIAVADAFLGAPEDQEGIRQRLIASVQHFGKLYPYFLIIIIIMIISNRGMCTNSGAGTTSTSKLGHSTAHRSSDRWAVLHFY